MSVLVTGAGGFLGCAVVRRLMARGEENVRVLVRTQSQARALEELGEGRVDAVTGDLRSSDALERALRGVSAVYHLAATMRGGVPEMVMGTVVGSQRLIEAVDRVDPMLPIVLVSSFAVYGTAGLPAGARVDETTPLEPRPLDKGGYAYTKSWQERLFVEHAVERGSALVILRPGVIYGPGGLILSSRVGIQLPGVFLHLGRGNVIPFTYVDNCADAVVLAGRSGGNGADGPAVYNVVDDDLWTSARFLRAYRRGVTRVRYVTLPYAMTRALAWCFETYHRRSHGQLPAFITRYQVASHWKGNTFSNQRLKSTGWTPLVSTQEGMERTFADARRLLEAEDE